MLANSKGQHRREGLPDDLLERTFRTNIFGQF